mmetsp:Transcript_19486/g.54194  ORF Transcript_19486/g.54194 Transcript_19486/m.54194 type:complete len:258 (+) Transcript_19486:247-1020(+)
MMATATLRETSRILLMLGKVRPSLISSAVMELVQAAAARYSILSVMRDTPETVAARPMPGKMYILLHWEGITVRPSSSFTGAKGLPEATTARPSVHLYACSAVHSDLDVGLLMGMMMGVLLIFAMLRITGSLKMPATVERPSKMLGLKDLTVSSSDVPSETASLSQMRWISVSPRAWLGSPNLPSALPSAPLEVQTAKREKASLRERPASTMPSIIWRHTPRPAEPAPAQTMRESLMSAPAFLTADRMPLRVTEPVP